MAFFHHTYGSVDNRLSETTQAGTSSSVYDRANRLASVDGVGYTWDNNGNLLDDGSYTYSYDHANRLVGVSGQQITASYAYNGLGDRLQQTVNGETTDFTMDLNTGLMQVLADGIHTYLYGVGRIAQQDADGIQYFLGDSLGSVRQLVDHTGTVTLARAYEPYGGILGSAGEGLTRYGFTGEWTDYYIKYQYLRSRWYAPERGRFISKDVWSGDYTRPMSLNGWNYVYANPINRTDPSGHSPLWCGVPLIGCVDTAKNAVLAAKAAYSQVGPIPVISKSEESLE